MDRVISMTGIKTKRGRQLSDDEANHKFLYLKMAGKFKKTSIVDNEIHEKWLDNSSKEFTVIYKEN